MELDHSFKVINFLGKLAGQPGLSYAKGGIGAFWYYNL